MSVVFRKRASQRASCTNALRRAPRKRRSSDAAAERDDDSSDRRFSANRSREKRFTSLSADEREDVRRRTLSADARSTHAYSAGSSESDAMAEQLLNGAQIRAAVEQMRGACVAKRMRMQIGAARTERAVFVHELAEILPNPEAARRGSTRRLPADRSCRSWHAIAMIAR